MNTAKYLNGGGRWDCYQHCYIREDYEVPVNTKLIFSQIEEEYKGTHGNKKSNAFFAQYITEFDVGDPTEWYFTIKDSEYDLQKLQAKKRYEITKARKFCITKKITGCNYEKELFDCYVKAFDAYPEKYRLHHFNYEDFKESVRLWDKNQNIHIYASFFIETNLLIGFLLVEQKNQFVKLVMQKTNPAYEKYNSNASLIDCMLIDWNEKIKTGEVVVTNGSRSIRHQTNFNAYLEKYFGFRKAYARLAIVYRFPFGIIVFLLKPFMKLFERTKNPFFYNIYCVLKMDSFKYRKRKKTL